MNLSLLTAAPAAADPVRLAIEYAVYAAIIVIGIVVLLLLRRTGKLPKHAEFQRQLAALEEELRAFSPAAAALTRYPFLRRTAKLAAKTERLEYTATQMAEKERDGGIGNAAAKLSAAREQLAAYKFGRRGSEDLSSIAEAAEAVCAAKTIFEEILARDAELKARRETKP